MAVLVGTAAKRSAYARWLGRCSTGRWANILMWGRTVGGVPEPAVDAFRAFEMALTFHGYKPVSCWVYNFRRITGSSFPCTCGDPRGCSLHSYGICPDIDPHLNPYTTKPFSWKDTAFTPAQIAAVEAIRNTKGEQVWEWGGRWSSVRDYMHFELRVTPDSLEIDWSTVAGYEPSPEPTPEKPMDPIPLKSWAIGSFAWAIANRIYIHDPNSLDTIRETEDMQRVIVFIHRYHTNVEKGAGGGLSKADVETMIRATRLQP